MSSFERYRGGAAGVNLQGLAQMFSDLKLIPSPLCYAQMRATYHGMHADEENGLDYSSFIEVLPVLAGIAFPGTRRNAAEKLMTQIRQHLPPPLTHIAAVLAEERLDAAVESSAQKSDSVKTPRSPHPSRLGPVPILTGVANGALDANHDAEGLGEAMLKVKTEAQRKLERLAEEFAGKQIELQRQREAAEKKLEAELQFELAQNVVRSNARQKRAVHPSTERLDLEEKLAALDRTRARRPSRLDVQDDASEKLDQERVEMTRRVNVLKVKFYPTCCSLLAGIDLPTLARRCSPWYE